MFALKFGKAEDANEFKKHFEEAKEVMKAFMPSKCLLLARSGTESHSFMPRTASPLKSCPKTEPPPEIVSHDSLSLVLVYEHEQQQTRSLRVRAMLRPPMTPRMPCPDSTSR